MDPQHHQGASGASTAPSVPARSISPSVLAAHAQKGLPAFGIYGHDVQDADDDRHSRTDVQEKLLRFGRAAVAAATMRGKSYLQIGSDLHGHRRLASSTPISSRSTSACAWNPSTRSRFIRRMDEGHLRPRRVRPALMAWAEEELSRRASTRTPQSCSKSREQKDEGLGIHRQNVLHHQGSDERQPQPARRATRRKWSATTPSPAASRVSASGRTSIPTATSPRPCCNTSFDWNGAREPYVLATENDTLNGVSHAVHEAADQPRPDVRRRAHLLEPRGGQAKRPAMRLKARAKESGRLHPPDQLRRRRVWTPTAKRATKTATRR